MHLEINTSLLGNVGGWFMTEIGVVTYQRTRLDDTSTLNQLCILLHPSKMYCDI